MNSPSGDNNNKKFQVIFVLGGPGCGKGTQCSNISKEFGYVHLSAGDLLRIEKDNPNSEHGQMILNHMKAGTIVPVEITCSLLERAMKESGKNKFLVDGFPRNQNNLDGWCRQMSDKVNIQAVIHIDCDDDVCVQRCLSRGSGRPDDNAETLKKRLVQFKNECRPIIDHFNGQNLVLVADGNLPADQVFALLKAKISLFQ